MTRATSSARAAANSSASERGSSSIEPSLSTSRIRSPAGVPPGSRTATTRSPRASRSICACVVLPARSTPSKVTNNPAIGPAKVTAEEAVTRIVRLMRAIVTGGAGFIGSNVVDALLERGDEVTVIDDLSTGRRENLDQALANGARLVEADIRDAAAVRDIVADASPEAIFHLAAQIDVRKSVSDPGHD